MTAEILWTKPVCKEPSRYIGWPTVCARRNGELVAVFSGDRNEHICPFGKVQLVRSSDGGETWCAPVTIRNSRVDDRDAGVLELNDGTLVVNSFSSTCFGKMRNDFYRRAFAKIPEADIRRDIGYWSLRSTDGGHTWEEPVRMRGSSPHGGIQLKDGRLLHVGRRHNAEGNMAASDPENVGRIHELPVEVSSDGGRSWRVLSKITPQAPYLMTETHEPHVVELDDGTLVVHIRYHGDRRRTVQCESRDGGLTWSDLHETGIPGYPSFLLKLKDGRLLSSYARRDKGHYGEYAVLSADGGKSWDNEQAILICPGDTGDLGYPSTVQLTDGSLLTVYYQAHRPGEMPCVMATKWRLNEGKAGALPKKCLLGCGWDLLTVSTEDIWRNRQALAEVGLDGFKLTLDRTDANGQWIPRGDGSPRDLLCSDADGRLWRDADFDRGVTLMRDVLALPGLRESMAMAYLIPKKRLSWTDDAAWARATSNAAVYARAVRRAGFRGIVIDDEDYSKQRQFRHVAGDPDYPTTQRLARRRARAFFGAIFAEFPNVRLMPCYIFTEQRKEIVTADDVAAAAAAQGTLKPSFMNGMLDVLPPTATVIDGNEFTGYSTDGDVAAFGAVAYESLRTVMPLVAPENRAKYKTQMSVGFGQYLDCYTQPVGRSHWQLPELGGSRLNRFQRNLMAACRVADEVVWIYGECGQFIDWGPRTDHRCFKCPTWEKALPGVTKLFRLASGGTDAARKLAAAGSMTNLVANSACDGEGSSVPPEYSVWTRDTTYEEGRFSRSAEEGALKLTGSGAFTATACEVHPGDILYIRYRGKGARPKGSIGWKRDGNYDWTIRQNFVNEVTVDHPDWRVYETLVVVPENVNGIGLILGGSATPESPVFFDDIEIFR